MENGVGSYTYTLTDTGIVTIKAEFEGNGDYNSAKIEEDLIVGNNSTESSSGKNNSPKLNIVENEPSIPPADETPTDEKPADETPESEPPVPELPTDTNGGIQIELMLIIIPLILVFTFGLYYRKK